MRNCEGGGGGGVTNAIVARASLLPFYLLTSWSAGRGYPPKFPSSSDRTSRPGQLTPSQWETTGQRPTGFSSPSPRSARLAAGGILQRPLPIFAKLNLPPFFPVAPLPPSRGGECAGALSKTGNLKEGLTWISHRRKGLKAWGSLGGGGCVATARFPFDTSISFSFMRTRNLYLPL